MSINATTGAPETGNGIARNPGQGRAENSYLDYGITFSRYNVSGLTRPRQLMQSLKRMKLETVTLAI